MITSVTIQQNGESTEVAHYPTIKRLNAILEMIAQASIYDPGETDLDDEQPVRSVTGLTLGDVRLVRRLVR